ncbi:MAG: heme-copper oxidase subunit III [Terriglobia bacterium]
MQRTLTEEEEAAAAGGGGVVHKDVRGWSSEGSTAEAVLPLHTSQLGLWALLATLTMLFAGFTSAYLVRRAGSDWQAISMPPILWFNTVVLLASSLAMEAARRRIGPLKRWLFAATALGFTFLAGQLFAWQQLAAQGVYLPTSPHSSFFYMLTAVHGLHLVGGLAALLYAFLRVGRPRRTPAEFAPLNLCATYWHFVDGVWVYLFVLLFAW